MVERIFLILKILWSYDFSPKVHIFLLCPLNNDPIFKVVQAMGTYIRGNITVAPDRLWLILWQDTYEALKSLTECGMADDDQTLMLMAYRRHPVLMVAIHLEDVFTSRKGIMLFIDSGVSRGQDGRLKFKN